MVKKDRKWEQTEKQEKVFKELKKRFTQKPVLAVLDLDKKMRMKVDASDNVIIEVLLIDCKDRQQRLVVYLSKSLNKIEI